MQSPSVRHDPHGGAVAKSTASGTSLTEVAAQLDRCLGLQDNSAGEKEALALMATLIEDGTLLGFGKAQQVPKRLYTIEELRLNQISTERLLSPEDKSLDFVRKLAQFAAVSGVSVLSYANHWDAGQTIAAVLTIVFMFTLDQVANQGGGEALVLDTLGRLLQPSYGKRVALHESGHFLVAYLIGILPRAYTLSSLDTFRRYGVLNVQAGCQFCDEAFSQEVATGKLGSGSLDRYTCVALAGVVTEYLRFEQAEGGLGDVQQIDGMYKALQFSQKKADSELRWAVLNTAQVLRRHPDLHDTLAEAMSRGESVGSCIAVIEKHLQSTPNTV
ncbi:MAG: hypothetical protein WDW36_005744 [Sanguina aurantia]